MTPERWARVQELFHRALERAPGARAAFLAAACDEDSEMKAKVEELLRADARESGFFPDLAEQVAREAAEDAADEAHVQLSLEGRRLGPYTLLRSLGYGGMGVVYLARRDDVGKDAALKLVRGGMAEPEHVTRFLAERRILARLQHPSVAQLLDAGVAEDGTPWLAMEYVEGEPLDRFCGSRRLTATACITLFEKVCAGVAYAHRNLVVHRDIKPSNILVTPDGDPKLLDFGIAKLLEGDDGPGLTRTGARLFTPEFAAPEQLAGGAITTATDVYQLGSLLAKLLSDLPGAARRPRKDLRAIVARATAAEPERRYPSVEQLRDDLRRHRTGLPVVARPDAWSYRAGRFVARHRAGVAAAAAAVVLLAGFAGTVTHQRNTIAAERDRVSEALAQSEIEAGKATQASEFLTGLFDAGDPFTLRTDRPDTMRLRDFLVLRGAEVASLERQPAVQVQALGVVGSMYHNLGLDEHARPALVQALAVGRELYPDGHDDLVRTLTLLGELYHREGDLRASERQYREALGMGRALHAGPNAGVATVLLRLGDLLRHRGDRDVAEPLLREALDQRRALLGDRHPRTAEALNNLGLLLWAGSDLHAAEPLLREALAVHGATLPATHALTAATLNNLGNLLSGLGELEEAEEHLRRSLSIREELFGPAHWRTVNGLINLSSVLSRLGRYDEAEASADRAYRSAREALAPNHELVVASLEFRGHARERLGRLAAAEADYREGLGVLGTGDRADNARAGGLHFLLARQLLRRNEPAEAADHLTAAVRISGEAVGENHWHTMRASGLLGVSHVALGRNDAAEPLLLAAAALVPEHGEADPETARWIVGALAGLLEARGEMREADRLRQSLPR